MLGLHILSLLRKRYSYSAYSFLKDQTKSNKDNGGEGGREREGETSAEGIEIRSKEKNRGGKENVRRE